jgi:hypothetical protein
VRRGREQREREQKERKKEGRKKNGGMEKEVGKEGRKEKEEKIEMKDQTEILELERCTNTKNSLSENKLKDRSIEIFDLNKKGKKRNLSASGTCEKIPKRLIFMSLDFWKEGCIGVEWGKVKQSW